MNDILEELEAERCRLVAAIVANHLSIGDPVALERWFHELRRAEAQRIEDDGDGWK